MPSDLFVMAQIAGDLLDCDGHHNNLVAGTGFLALGVWYYNGADFAVARAEERSDRIDASTQGFLGLTIACARCHDHKYDPISMRDYYALDSIMASTVYRDHPLTPEETVKVYEKYDKKVKDAETTLKEFLDQQSIQISSKLAHKTAEYLMAAWRQRQGPSVSVSPIDPQEELDPDILAHWIYYLDNVEKRHSYLQT